MYWHKTDDKYTGSDKYTDFCQYMVAKFYNFLNSAGLISIFIFFHIIWQKGGQNVVWTWRLLKLFFFFFFFFLHFWPTIQVFGFFHILLNLPLFTTVNYVGGKLPTHNTVYIQNGNKTFPSTFPPMSFPNSSFFPTVLKGINWTWNWFSVNLKSLVVNFHPVHYLHQSAKRLLYLTLYSATVTSAWDISFFLPIAE